MPGWWARLFGGGAQSEAVQRLDRLECQLADLRVQIEALHSVASAAAHAANGVQLDLAPFSAALGALEKQIGRAGREQLKSNSIVEAQAAQLTAALEQLAAAEARREAELQAMREQSRNAQATARLDVVQAILPALDGLDEALRAGPPLLAIGREQAANRLTGGEAKAQGHEQPAPFGWLQRLLGEPAPSSAPACDTAALGQLAELRAGIESWLAGLGFVRQRLLGALAAQAVRPIVAVGQPFDPNYHVAIGVTPATASHPAGSVAEELRRGYLAGERGLRHAEVVVAAAERELEDQHEGARA